jgi:hypothetical protein
LASTGCSISTYKEPQREHDTQHDTTHDTHTTHDTQAHDARDTKSELLMAETPPRPANNMVYLVLGEQGELGVEALATAGERRAASMARRPMQARTEVPPPQPLHGPVAAHPMPFPASANDCPPPTYNKNE